MIRLALFSYLPDANRGGQLNLLRLVRGLDPTRYTLTVVTPGAGSLADEAAAAGARVVTLPVEGISLQAARDLSSLPGHARQLRTIRRVLREIGSELLYLDSSHHLLPLRLAAMGLRRRVVWHVQTAQPTEYDWYALRVADAVAYVSESAEARLHRLRGPARRLRIPNAVDAERFRPGPRTALRARHGVGPEDVVLLFVGSLERSKGTEELLRAFAQARATLPTLKLWLVGPASTERLALHERLIRELAVEPHVELWGSLEQTDELYREADLFVLPSHSEGMPLALLEAMSTALPCVASDIPGNRELLRAGAGLLTPRGSVPALAQAFIRLGIDAQRRTELGRKARSTILEGYTIARYLAAFDELFTSLARRSS